MSAPPPNLGVAAPSGTPPQWPDAAQLSPLPKSPSISTAPTWPRPALWATVLLLAVALVLLGWNVYASGRWAARPTALERDAVRTGRLDLNRADRAQLLQLPGVGETLAARIEAYRDEHNGFRDVEELRQVQGIGPVLVEKLRPLVHVVPFDGDEEGEPREEPRRPATPTRPTKNVGPGKPPAAKKVDQLNGPIDVNRASAEELQRLPGIGPTLSERIIEARKRAPFKKIDDLRHVSGIGRKTLDRLRPFVTVGDPEPEKKD